MNGQLKFTLHVLGSVVTFLLFLGCGQDRVLLTTGTQIGLEATPGDTSTQAPSVSFGYKRIEIALVPVAETTDEHKGKPSDPKKATKSEDAYSTLATFSMAHNWFGPAKIEQFIATGHAARNIQKLDSAFSKALIADKP